MKARAFASVSALLLALIAPRVHAQCSTWLDGPLDNGTAPNGTNGTVYAITQWDPSGTGLSYDLVVAGQFTSIQGVTVSNIAVHVPGVGWQTLNGGVDGIVYAVTVFNGELIVGGQFRHAGGLPVNFIARWNGSTWRTLPYGTSADGVNLRVLALTVYNNKLAVGGSFTAAGCAGGVAPGGPGAVPASQVATWDTTSSWQALNAGLGPTGEVECLASWNGNLITGGSFTTADNSPVGHIAQWNGSAWSPMGAGMDDEVDRLQGWNGVLVASGIFSHADGNPANGIAYWNGSAWSAFSSSPGPSGSTVFALTVYNGFLVVGCDQFAGGVAEWTGSAWKGLGGGVGGGTNPGVAALFPYASGELIGGGGFSTAGGVPANNIARWNGFEWAPFGGGVVGDVFAMTQYLGNLVAGGDFHESTETGYAAHEVAGWNGTTLSSYGSGMDGAVYALKSYSFGLFVNRTNELVAGGAFLHAGGVAANYIAKWDQTSIQVGAPAWAPMGGGFNSGVYAIERFNNQTYAGGAFTSPDAYIGRWNTTTSNWDPLGTGMNGAVRAMKVFGSYLYVGGSFTTANGIATGGLARFDGTNWSQVGGTFVGTVFSLDVYNGVLVIGGSFPGISGSPNIAFFDGTNYGVFGTGGTNGTIHSVSANGSRLYIGGQFSSAGGASVSNVAYWDGSSWHDANGGTNDLVLAMAPFNGEEEAGGLFNHVQSGAVLAPAWARYSGSGLPWYVAQPASQAANPGDNISFSATPSSGFSGIAYRWYHGGSPLSDGPNGQGSTLSGSATPTLSIANVVGFDEGNYFLAMSNVCGADTSSTVMLTVNGVTAVMPDQPGVTSFEAIRPNPTLGAASLVFSLAQPARVRVRVHDIAGRLVEVIDLGSLPAGHEQAMWNARSADGRRISSGMYFLSLEINGRVFGSRRVSLVR